MNAPTSQLQLSQGGGGVTNRPSPTNAADEELHLRRRRRPGDTEQQPAGDQFQQRVLQSAVQLAVDVQLHAAAAARLPDRHAASPAGRLAGEPRDLRRAAAGVDDEPRLERAQRHRDYVFTTQAVEVARQSFDPASKLFRTTRRVEVGTMAPIDVVQAQAEQATRRQGWSRPRTRGAPPNWPSSG